MRTIEHWVAGKTTTGVSDRTAAVYNPATGEQQAEVLLADVSDVEAAIAAASDAFPAWSQTSISKRTKVLFAFREIVNARAKEIASAITDEHGKVPVSYTHLRAHETDSYLVCRLLLEKKKTK